MSVQFDSSRNRWVVRWYEAGRQRSRRFGEEPAARAVDAEQRAAKTLARQESEAELASELAQLRARVVILERQVPDDARSSGVSAYATRQGVRWRVAVPQPDGSVTTRRGYRTHEAACQAHERLTHLACPGAQASFARYWRAWLAEKRAYLTEGALEDLETHGRKRLLPHLAHLPLGDITERHVRDWLNAMTEQHQAGAISAKTINNARAALSGALGDAARRDLLPSNPCRFVSPLPIEHRELAYLRLSEIDPYLRACPAHYRPLAELLIGTGARISEALALTWPDIDLDHGTVQIQRQRARHGDRTTQTKGKRAHTVLIGPRLTETLRTLRNTHPADGHPDWLFICPQPSRGRYANRSPSSLPVAEPSTNGTTTPSVPPAFPPCHYTHCATPPPPAG